MEAQITTRYRAKYAVTIMGKGYGPGDEIIDPKIDGKVLRRLADNGRVVLVPHVHVSAPVSFGEEFDDGPESLPEDEGDDDGPEGDDDDGDEGGDGDEPESEGVDPLTAAPATNVDGAAKAAVLAATKAAAQPLAVQTGTLTTTFTGMALNAAWKAAFAKHRENGETLKGYLQRVLQEHKIKATGPVQELVNRLASAGVQPGVAGH